MGLCVCFVGVFLPLHADGRVHSVVPLAARRLVHFAQMLQGYF